VRFILASSNFSILKENSFLLSLPHAPISSALLHPVFRLYITRTRDWINWPRIQKIQDSSSVKIFYVLEEGWIEQRITLLTSLTPAGNQEPPGEMEERITKVRVRKLMSWDKDSLTEKAQAMHTSKAKQEIHSLLPIGRQVFANLQKSRAPSYLGVIWEDKCHHSKFPSFLLFLPAFIAECDITWHGISLWWTGVSCPSCVLFQLLVHLQPTRWQDGVRSRGGLDSITKTSLYYQHSSLTKSKTEHYTNH